MLALFHRMHNLILNWPSNIYINEALKNAIKKGYPITAKQIADMCKQFDNDTGKWYENRPMELEADRALEYVYRN